ncbi:MAG TPA: HAD hydrolase family protein [Gemmatimonadales bacterium]|jgi:3-deoxy-D-manno-octulosonate 8-phosphate phosphatase (KDO 8-P phosphatase)
MTPLGALAAQRVRLLGLDVDGVLTDNGVYIGPVAGDRIELKRFDIQDGLGLILLKTAGLPVVWVSGRSSEATALRAAELRVEELLQVPGPRKAAAFEEVLERYGLGWDAAAFVGDDLADLPILRRVGLPIAVSNAVPEVKQVAAYVTQAPGGHGAVREIVEALLRARGEWPEILERYFAEQAAGAA